MTRRIINLTDSGWTPQANDRVTVEYAYNPDNDTVARKFPWGGEPQFVGVNVDRPLPDSYNAWAVVITMTVILDLAPKVPGQTPPAFRVCPLWAAEQWNYSGHTNAVLVNHENNGSQFQITNNYQVGNTSPAPYLYGVQIWPEAVPDGYTLEGLGMQSFEVGAGVMIDATHNFMDYWDFPQDVSGAGIKGTTHPEHGRYWTGVKVGLGARPYPCGMQLTWSASGGNPIGGPPSWGSTPPGALG